MARHRRQWSLDEKARIVEAVAAKVADGETIKAASVAHGITENLFRAWRAKGPKYNHPTKAKRTVKTKRPVLDAGSNGHAVKASPSRILPAWDVVNDRHFLAAVSADGGSVFLVPADDLTQAMSALAALRG